MVTVSGGQEQEGEPESGHFLQGAEENRAESAARRQQRHEVKLHGGRAKENEGHGIGKEIVKAAGLVLQNVLCRPGGQVKCRPDEIRNNEAKPARTEISEAIPPQIRLQEKRECEEGGHGKPAHPLKESAPGRDPVL